MSQQVINVGTVANDGTGDPLRTAFIAVNGNFAELYGLMPRDSGNNLTPAAPLNSPHFTGDPQINTTPPPGDADMSIANTAFVTGADNLIRNDMTTALALKANIAAPILTGDAQTAQVIADNDSDKTIANTEWVKRNFAIIKPDAPPPAGVDLALYAPLVNPVFSGTPGPRSTSTLPPNDNSTNLATTKFVQDVILGLAPGPPGSTDPIPPTLAKYLGTPPAGRLTLQSKQPIMSGNITGAVSIHYTPYIGNTIPIFNGTDMIITRFTDEPNNKFELTANLNDATNSPSPGGLQAGKVYDWFVWEETRVAPLLPLLHLSRGPAWDGLTARSSGSAITRVNGIWLNLNAIENGPPAKRGTYVGTTYCATANQLVWQWGGVNLRARFHVWNAYNRVTVGCTVVDDTASWTVYSENGEWNYMNLRQANRAEAVIGLQDDAVTATMGVVLGTDSATAAYVAIGFDWNPGDNAEAGDTDHPGIYGWSYIYQTGYAFHSSIPDMGFHWWQAIERTDAGLSYAAYGYLVNSYSTGLIFNARM